MMLFQLYKFVKNMMNSKVDLEGFTNTSFVDRSPFVANSDPSTSADFKSTNRNTGQSDDSYQTQAEEFEFDASEIGGVIYDNFEEYTG